MATKREGKGGGDRPKMPAKPAAGVVAGRTAIKKVSPRGPAAKKADPSAKKTSPPRRGRQEKQKIAEAPKPKVAARRKPPTPPKPVTPVRPGLTDEEKIEDAKYQPRAAAKRVFEEERFVFPETYGVTRVRLLVKDPDWIFVHWDVDPKTLAALRAELGERAMALTRLTLRIADAERGGGQTILLPPGARSWYVRADAHGPRAYQAELGVTLPSGGFRALAQSNVVVPPRVGPSPELAKVKRRVGGAAAKAAAGETSLETYVASPIAETEAAQAPWRPAPARTDAARVEISALDAGERGRAARGGSSERSGRAERGGASDVHRR